MNITLKQGDTWPPLKATLQQANGTAINLTEATVRLMVINRQGTEIIDHAAAITNAISGQVQYDWHTSDTANAGIFRGEFEVTFAGGAIVTVPNNGYFEIQILSQLG